jgi:hypothetical protein
MALSSIAGALIMVFAACNPAYAARDAGISQAVEEVLVETHFERPPSLAEKRQLVERLRRRGIETVTDLQPYLGRSETVRQNTLFAIEQMGDIDPKTLRLIENLAREAEDSPAPSVTTAVRLVLEKSEWAAALDFASAIAPKSHHKPLLEIMAWISAQDQSLLSASEKATALTRICLYRMDSLFETGTYSGEQPLSFSMAVQRPPFNDNMYAENVTGAFLSAIENAARMKDMREIGFISSFAIVARGAEVTPQLVEDGLIQIVTTGPSPLVKLVLWRMTIDGLASTKSGERILAAASEKSPGLAGYLDELRSLDQGVAGMDSGLKNEIEQALRDLQTAPGG